MGLFFEKIKRNYIGYKMMTIRNGWKKMVFLKKKKIFKNVGSNCCFHSNILPAEPFLVSFGDNVVVAAGVRLITHSAQHIVFNHSENTNKFKARFGEIIIGNNVFIGADSIILYNVTIGNNVIIAAGSIVTKSVPDNSVVAGAPARIIETYEELKSKEYNYSLQFEGCESNRVIDLYRYISK